MTITVVQSKVITGANSGSFNSATTAGNTVFAVYAGSSGGTGTPSVSGVTLGGSADHFAAQLVQNEGTQSYSVSAIWMDANCAGGQTAVAVTGSNLMTAAAYLLIIEVSGMGNAPHLDQSSKGPLGAGTQTWTSNTTGTLSSVPEFIIGVTAHGPFSSGDSLTTPGSPWVNSVQYTWSGGVSVAGYLIETGSVGGINYSGTSSDFDYYTAIIGAFVPVTSGGSTVTGSGGIALQPLGFSGTGQAPVSGHGSPALQPIAFSGTGTITGGVPIATISNVVTGNVVNDYGLDSVPYTIGTPGTGTMLAALIGWDVATAPTQSSGKAPAVNVTDSAGNLWRQVGISASSPQSRSAIWVADNPRQVDWVSVALTGWGFSTGYMICEIDDIPATLGAVSLDFVKTGFSTAATTGLMVTAGTATTTDLILGVVTTGGYGGAMTVPSGFSGLEAVGSPSVAGDVTVYGMYVLYAGTGTYSFTPTWSNSAPSSAVVAALRFNAPAPVQSNPNFPNVVIEAAFGAQPGDWTQSVDYTWDVTGLTWTDITLHVFGGRDDDGSITTQRGRQYELNQEEAGELDIRLSNMDGVFTVGNAQSPYYPYVIPGTPLRVTAWFGGVQYPVAFGYADKWPQEWPQMPQWGFSNISATDAYGAMAAANLPSAVMGDIRKDNPFAYFPTEEQYEFTTQSLDPVQAPLDANGLIAVNYAFGNNRYGAYRDGFDQPVTVGQALNLMGDQNTTLGATTYTGQETADNGPGMFYFDPNLPVNAGGKGFSVEFWFAWGATNQFSCTLFSAYAAPSSFYVESSVPTNGGVVTVGINTGPLVASTVTSGFFVNGVEITGGQFNQATLQPQHFVLTTGPDGTACYLNGVLSSTAVTLGTIPQLRAIALGPARFSYDVSGLVTYNGYNYVAGHLAWYGQELTPTMIANHYESGITGFVGDPAPGRYAQVLTWGGVGLKRGGTAWYAEYGNAESTYMSEAYSYDGSSAADIMSQITQSEGGRCFTQANGSVVYTYRWQLYDQQPQAAFGDSNVAQPVALGVNMGTTATSGLILTQFTGSTLATTYAWGSTAPSSTVATWNITKTGTQFSQGDQALVSVMNSVATTYAVSDSAGNSYTLIGQASTTRATQYLYLGTMNQVPGTISVTGTVAGSVSSSVYGLSQFGSYLGSAATVATGPLLILDTLQEFTATALLATSFSFGAGGATPSGFTAIGSGSGNGFNDNLSFVAESAGPELPFYTQTSFSVDNQFIFNQINATQQRGPNQDLFVQQNDFQSQRQYFLRSGLAYQSYAMLPADVTDLVNWSTAKYRQPTQRAMQVVIDLGGVQALNPTMFPVVMGLELNDVVTVHRRPVGGSPFSVTGAIQHIEHEIGPTYWRTTLQVTPVLPEQYAMIADQFDLPGTSYLAW